MKNKVIHLLLSPSIAHLHPAAFSRLVARQPWRSPTRTRSVQMMFVSRSAAWDLRG